MGRTDDPKPRRRCDRCGDDGAAAARSVALIGLRGCGKTSVGAALAIRLGGDRVDTDELVVQRAGHSIADIFATEGEVGFRTYERDVIAELVQAPPCVISVGGGAILDERNVADLRGVARLVWLTAPPGVLWSRVAADPNSDDTRPPLTDKSDAAEIVYLLDRRKALYQRAADLTVDTDGRSVAEVVETIVAWLDIQRAK